MERYIINSKMRKKPSLATLKKLFALSGNQCAFPDCIQRLIHNELLIGEICHIEAANKNGERYNPNQTDDQRADFENLIVFCPNHHKITNNIELYTVEILKDIKRSHEEKSKVLTEKITDEALEGLLNVFDCSDEMDDIYQKVLKEYSHDIVFIKSLTKSQQDWGVFCESYLNARFPHHDKPLYYGSVFPMCWGNIKASMIKDRIKQLQEWLDGTEEGNCCAGSLKVNYPLENI